jgi:hypothetical protein
MKNLSWRLGLAAACAALAVFGRGTPVFAAEQERGGPADRLERLERRVNEMAERQEQFMRRMGAAQERQAPMAAPGREALRQRMAEQRRPALNQPLRPAEAPVVAPTGAPGVPPVCPMKGCKAIGDLVGLFLLVAFIFNILIAIWIYADIRKRGEGSGIFVALALLAGVPAAIIYAIVRIGDKKA